MPLQIRPELGAEGEELRRGGHESRENTDQHGAVSGERGDDCNERSTVGRECDDTRDEPRADHDMRRENHRERGEEHDEF